jgi:two-component system LytT family response regulator
MRVLIADDEAPARTRLRQLFSAYTEFEVVAEAESGVEAIRLAAATKADLLLLDIQMPGGSGLDVAACLPAPRPAIIFCTAHDRYAVDAFALNAVDYLMKPVSRTRLAESLSRLSATVGPTITEPELTRFLVRKGAHYVVVPAASAAYFDSVDGLTRLVTESGQAYWVDPTLQDLESRLDPNRFHRIARGAIVNLTAVVVFYPSASGSAEVVLKGGTRLEVSRRRVRDLVRALETAAIGDNLA